VTLGAVNCNVFPGQPERNLVMVEFSAQGLDAVVAACAAGAECEPVGQDESRVRLQVAVAARVLAEFEQSAPDVAITATECLAVTQSLMGVEGESQRRMWKGPWI
jgi:hypothetical protein